MGAPANTADVPAHLSDEFPAGYSLTRCSPAELASASPAGVDDVSAQVQVRGFFNNNRTRTEKRDQFHRQQSTLRSPFFCPKNGETLTHQARLLFLLACSTGSYVDCPVNSLLSDEENAQLLNQSLPLLE